VKPRLLQHPAPGEVVWGRLKQTRLSLGFYNDKSASSWGSYRLWDKIKSSLEGESQGHAPTGTGLQINLLDNLFSRGPEGLKFQLKDFGGIWGANFKKYLQEIRSTKLSRLWAKWTLGGCFQGRFGEEKHRSDRAGVRAGQKKPLRRELQREMHIGNLGGKFRVVQRGSFDHYLHLYFELVH